MTEQATQSRRFAELTTPLGKDKLLLSSFHAHEELGRPFEINVSCISEKELVDFSECLGNHCVIRFRTTGDKKRYFSGVLAEAKWIGKRDRGFDYALVLRPWFWLLKHTSDSRVFQHLSVPDIIKKVFNDLGFTDFKFNLKETYKPVEYCVQYRESHFDFVSRLMELNGIYYYFEHSEAKHDMVFADQKKSHSPVPDLPTCEYLGRAEMTRGQEGEYIYEWASGRAFRTGKVMVNGYDFATPNASLKHSQSSPGGHARDQLEHYMQPHKFKKGEAESVGKRYAQAWLYAAQSEDKRRMATGDAASLFPGGLVKIEKHPVKSENAEYLVVAASHSFTGELFTSGQSGGEISYHGEFLFQPSDRPYKSQHITPSPIIAGPQTALVVGPAGEEIHSDKHGRVKVQFHWDREGKKDQNSSRWVRVGQIWSGKAWGGIVIPRIGMEVIVEFIEGDPDRPIIVGTVYNGENTPPFDLPANQTISGVKTRSSKGGNPDTYNELVFEDSKDKEKIRVHAERDLNVTVENIETRIVKAKTLTGPGKTARETTIETGDDFVTIANGDGLSKISRDVVAEIGRDQSTKIDNDMTTKVGHRVLIQAGTSIQLKVGGSSITITEAGITVKTGGYINTSAKVQSMKADAKFSIKGPKIEKN